MSSKTHKKVSSIMLIIFIIIGMLIALFLLYEHFTPDASKFCNFGEGFDCGIVNKSPYANLDGISYLLTIDFGWPLPYINLSDKNAVLDLLTSVAFLGFLTLLFLLILRIAKYKNKNFLFVEKEMNIKWVRWIMAFGVLFGLYLFFIQHFILKTYCIFCLALDISMIAILISAWSCKE